MLVHGGQGNFVWKCFDSKRHFLVVDILSYCLVKNKSIGKNSFSICANPFVVQLGFYWSGEVQNVGQPTLVLFFAISLTRVTLSQIFSAGALMSIYVYALYGVDVAPI